MADVRDIVNSLSMEDKAVWNEHRTCMRKCYLEAINDTIGINNFAAQDDSFLDLIDIRLALLFDRAGMLPASEVVSGRKEAKDIEETIIKAEDVMKAGKNKDIVEESEATRMIKSTEIKDNGSVASNGWGQPK